MVFLCIAYNFSHLCWFSCSLSSIRFIPIQIRMKIAKKVLNKNILIISVLFFMLLLFYQNCSKVGFAPQQSVSAQCVQGKKLGIWLNDGSQKFLGDIVTYSGNLSAKANYNYYSASAHPINGPDPIGYELHNFFYEGTDGLTLNFYANIDSNDQSEGSPDNQYALKIVTRGNNGVDHVLFIDDPNAPNTDWVNLKKYSDRNEYDAHFHYWYNTDGAIIGPFDGEDFEIYVDIVKAGDLKGARFYSANGSSFNLGNAASMSYMIKYREYEDCK
jgi:hypothetical protein